MEALIALIFIIVSVVIRTNSQVKKQQQQRQERKLKDLGIPMHRRHYTDHGEEYEESLREENRRRSTIRQENQQKEELSQAEALEYKQSRETKIEKQKEELKEKRRKVEQLQGGSKKRGLGAAIGDSIKEGEIGASNNVGNLFTERRQLVNGIIMSEVLKKPKHRR
ncbi:hypothetical protein PRVXH_001148 [Proteinivorax hydrogeniformans]|uniref:Uncharacterized protein n=1 Tax=Proteinivorax hydrogeniformans TaxID=1826727 RepID=A0AAU8HWS4_9FIRM